MRQLTIRTAFDLHDSLQKQQRQQESQGRANQAASNVVGRMFPQNRVSPGVSQLLESAVARMEGCREQDTDSYGEEMPRPMTRGTMDMGVHDSVAHLPQRPGALDMSPEGRTDAKGRPLHYFDGELNAWIPARYED